MTPRFRAGYAWGWSRGFWVGFGAGVLTGAGLCAMVWKLCAAWGWAPGT